MRRLVAVWMLCAVLLSGCVDVFDGEYSSVRPHQKSAVSLDPLAVTAADREELYEILVRMVEDGQEEAVVLLPEYDRDKVREDTGYVRNQITNHHPVGAYAVDWISFDQGTSEGQPALAVYIHYIHDRSEIRSIQSVTGVGEAARMIHNAMDRCDVSLVIQILAYEDTDFVQVVESYAMENPHLVMETPQVSVNLYPDSGDTRVLDLRFTYQTSRDALQSMQEQVEPVFEAAVEEAGTQEREQDKYAALYDFLMERSDYMVATSITPPYSLLRHGVGDSRAFAQVYGAMCRQSGLEGKVVSGTKDGASHYWNMVCCAGVCYHLDLTEGQFLLRTGDEMSGYVWDYSAYPEN